jgi:hypothetical protein
MIDGKVSVISGDAIQDEKRGLETVAEKMKS